MEIATRSSESKPQSDTSSTVNGDAYEFGQHFRQGGWRLGLYVARNVQHGKPGRPPNDNRSHETVFTNGSPNIDAKADGIQADSSAERNRKVSVNEFAKLAKVSKSHVLYHYRAWELAADDGYCQHAEQLSPGDEDASLDDIDQDDDERREIWLKYYRAARDPGKPRKPNSVGNECNSSSLPKKRGTPDVKLRQAVCALTATSEKFSRNLIKVVDGIGVKRVDDDANLARFAEELRKTRFVLDKQCREIDQLLERIGFGEADDLPDSELDSPGLENRSL